jgi:hypothetical protein
MTASPTRSELGERFFRTLAEAALPLHTGPDLEVALEALIEAAGRLKEHFEQELDHLRQEQAE